MSKTKKILSVVTIVWLCLFLTVFTYSWVLRNKTPSIYHDNLKISPAGALVISLQGDDNNSSVDLNQITSLDSFVFKQVSSLNGKHFMRLDFTPTIDGDEAEYRFISEGDTHKNDYIDTRFALKLDDSLEDGKYVFLHPDCVISDDNEELDIAKAIRIAIDVDVPISETETENRTFIFGNTTGDIPLDQSTMAVKQDADGKGESDSTAVGQQKVYNFTAYNGYTDGEFDPDKCLFKIEPGYVQWVNIRIWLEGADPNCKNEIAGQTFDLVLKFDSANAVSE